MERFSFEAKGAFGRQHEAKTAAGMTVLIVEGDGLEPFRRPA